MNYWEPIGRLDIEVFTVSILIRLKEERCEKMTRGIVKVRDTHYGG